LLRVGVHQVVKLQPCDCENRLTVKLGIIQSIQQVDSTGTGRSQAAPQTSRVFGVRACHKRGGLFVADLNKSNRGLPFAEGFYNSVDPISGKAEHNIYAPGVNCVYQNVRSSSGHTTPFLQGLPTW
jgi:hypothetical protein